MGAIFLSASVPEVGRGTYHESADPFLIQLAVRELVIAVIRDARIVWGGHPSITPMIWAICSDLGVEYSRSVALYQSRFFEDRFPEENQQFENVTFVDAVQGDREASLYRLRLAMVSRRDLVAGVFIGGMEGVEFEYDLFRKLHRDAPALLVAAGGGAARLLAERHGRHDADISWGVDFGDLFRVRLGPLFGAKSHLARKGSKSSPEPRARDNRRRERLSPSDSARSHARRSDEEIKRPADHERAREEEGDGD